MSTSAKQSKKQGSAPEWHFADEEAAQGEASASSSFVLAASNNKFILRGAIVILLLIAAMYTFDFKEMRALSSSQSPSTVSSKPHWQSTEEMKLRMAKRDGHHPDIFPGQQKPGEGDWLNNVNAEEWMDRVDAEVDQELRKKQIVDGVYDGSGYAGYADYN